MTRRRRLRSRVFTMTACYALMLFVVAFFLTWRAKQSQERAEHLFSVDLRAVAVLSELIRNQNAFHPRVVSAAGDEGSQLGTMATRYGTISQLLGDLGESAEVARIESEITSYRDSLHDSAGRWSEISSDDRAMVLEELDRRSRSIVRETEALARYHTRQTEVQLPLLAREASDMMWIAMATAWIIAIISFASARLTLAKVVTPIEDLSRAAEQLAAGELSARAPIGGDREIAQLGHAFNRMADALSRSYGELRARARTDELTGLPNFRAFREVIDGEVERANRYGHSFGVLVLDLDHFKKYNDRFGHLAGNEALVAVAAMVRASVRAVDMPARYGGEEFAVVLPEIDPAGLGVIGERIRRGVEALPVPEGRVPITISIGGALFPGDGIDVESLFATADQRLYVAKKKGRNRVVGPPSAVEAKAGA
ncbi:MAG TPA: diguanylate cyclase [Thermoanaerobaculia bacterium]|nr:diguanylate cyclase [Thermoanaerobaculia bacterium]